MDEYCKPLDFKFKSIEGILKDINQAEVNITYWQTYLSLRKGDLQYMCPHENPIQVIDTITINSSGHTVEITDFCGLCGKILEKTYK